MEYKIYWTNEAKIMLKKHISFLNQISINAGIKFKILIKESIVILKHFPKMGKKLKFDNKLSVYYRKMIIDKRYIIIYYIYNKEIYIKAILDCRQKNEKYF